MKAGASTIVTAAAALLVALAPGAQAQGRAVIRRPAADPRPAHQLRDPATWPAEPAVPDAIDAARFRAAFAHLCGAPDDGEVAALAPEVLNAAAGATVDPFLLAALAYYGSGCRPDFHAGAGLGLMAIAPSMYLAAGAPPPPVDPALLAPGPLLQPATNLAVGAALLRMWRDEHAAVDARVGGVRHRSEASHLVWGDEVHSSGQEDLILTARRRMLAAYGGAAEAPRPSPLGIPVVSPLEAPPRVATSGPGDERDGGARRHRGLDITATLGEPVRAIADGVVIFAGANLPGQPRKGKIPPERIARYAHRRFGAGGIYVCLEHQEERHVRSCYMHLASYVVRESEHVSAGQTIGFVGRTGVKVSPPHLHLEVRVDDRFTNPVRTLGDLVIPPKATETHHLLMRAHRLRA
jgi:murein DD-endopeptidase MepM/ murein hydrolase activator NlpD